MVTVIWALISKHAAITPEGELVIQGEFCDARFESYPVTAPLFYIVARLAFDNTMGRRIQTRIVGPGGTIIHFDEGERIEPKNSYGLLIIGFNNIIFPEAGTYNIDFLIKNKPFNTINLTLK